MLRIFFDKELMICGFVPEAYPFYPYAVMQPFKQAIENVKYDPEAGSLYLKNQDHSKLSPVELNLMKKAMPVIPASPLTADIPYAEVKTETVQTMQNE